MPRKRISGLQNSIRIHDGGCLLKLWAMLYSMSYILRVRTVVLIIEGNGLRGVSTTEACRTQRAHHAPNSAKLVECARLAQLVRALP